MGGKKVSPTPRTTREVTGEVPMATSVAVYNEGERGEKEGKAGREREAGHKEQKVGECESVREQASWECENRSCPLSSRGAGCMCVPVYACTASPCALSLTHSDVRTQRVRGGERECEGNQHIAAEMQQEGFRDCDSWSWCRMGRCGIPSLQDGLIAAPLPLSLSSPSHRRSSSSSSSPSPQRRRQTSKCSDEGALWKLDSTTDVKHRPFKPPRRDSSPSSSPSSSSSPMTAQTLMRKDIKSLLPLKCSKLSTDTPFHRSPPRSSSGASEGCYDGGLWDERHKLPNGSASQTAQILFSLGSVYNRPRGTEGREKIIRRPVSKPGVSQGPSLHPPSLHLPPPVPPPPPSEDLTAPSHSPYSPSDSLKPELICGVCHRLFSTAASLTVHMRLHRGSRSLNCCYCGKVFIHSKRLQSHEASCRVADIPSNSLGPPTLTMQPKEEPLEEGEVRVEGGVIVAQADITKARSGKKAQSLLARIQSDDAAAAELLAGDEHHFVKVVDGNVIYFCSVCERSYMTLSSLKRHSNVHSWRRKYPCHYCDKVFALAEYRTKHEVWHTGERRYQCIFCWDAFATYYNLKTHQKTIHGINPSLISSEKTANGGYKQKANALKLYRLLPMRSQKRPYKTYNDSLHNELLQPGETPPLPMPGLDCAMDSGDLLSHAQAVKSDPDDFSDSFHVAEPAEQSDHSGLPQLSQTDVSALTKHDGETEQGRTAFQSLSLPQLPPLRLKGDPGLVETQPSAGHVAAGFRAPGRETNTS
uniref:C2H2-type domain-containing protein n=1 Tax=Knipowitschia caucasica TaxID=637954 RepID=A0AAV2KUM4_KNICA